MKFVDEYRRPEPVNALINNIKQQLSGLPFTCERPMQVMEVCGGHTHAIFKFGLDQLLPKEIEFTHGPGCPVCVLPRGRIDTAITIAEQPDVIFCTFGDAIRVPGTKGSLLAARQRGAQVRMVYSPLDALALAKQNPDKHVVFFALGFETTQPATALTLQSAYQQAITNFSVFCHHIILTPTLRSLLAEGDTKIDAILAPGHVSMVIGESPYDFICYDYHKPVVITGFEPTDILQAVLMLLKQYQQKRCAVENQYRRVVPMRGNQRALAAMQDVFQTGGESEWRGLGMVADSGVTLTAKYADFDAIKRFNITELSVIDEPSARCGDVLTGRCKPNECPLFDKQCQPEHAVGALMVSSEGACAAWYLYRRHPSFMHRQ